LGGRPAGRKDVIVGDDGAERCGEQRTGVRELASQLLGSAAAAEEAGIEALPTMAPGERVAFVLHDRLGVPVEEVAAILGRSPTATRQLAGRGRRLVESPEVSLDAERTVHGRVVDAFLTAARTGDVEELAWLLHPDAVLHADDRAMCDGAREIRGAPAVAQAFAGRPQPACRVLLDGFAGAAWPVGARPEEVVGFTVVDGRIEEIELLADPEVVARLDLGPQP
jgi:Sigma-70, region 4